MAEFNFAGGGKVERSRVFGGGNFKLVINFDTIALAEAGREIMEDVIGIGEEAAIRRVPVQTGNLQGTIEGKVMRSGASIRGVLRVGGPAGKTAPYWAFVEYGTGIRGAASGTFTQSDDTTIRAQGFQHDYQGTNWKGMAARPFMRPALDDMAAHLGGGGN